MPSVLVLHAEVVESAIVARGYGRLCGAYSNYHRLDLASSTDTGKCYVCGKDARIEDYQHWVIEQHFCYITLFSPCGHKEEAGNFVKCSDCDRRWYNISKMRARVRRHRRTLRSRSYIQTSVVLERGENF